MTYLREWSPGWKVTNARNRSLNSLRIRAGVVQYGEGVLTEPHPDCGPLAVFDSRKRAADFADMLGGILHPCAYQPSVERELWIDNGNVVVGALNVPAGTCYADAVMLLGEDWMLGYEEEADLDFLEPED